MALRAILPPKSWRRRLAITAAVLLLLYAVAGFLVIPTVARPRLEAMLADYVRKPVKIGAIGLNPFALSVSLRDVAIEEEGAPPDIAFEELYADIRALSLLRLAVVLDSVHLEGPRVRLVLDKQGSVSLAELFATEEAAEPEPVAVEDADAELFPVAISSVTIENGHFTFRDEQPAEPFELVLTPVTLELEDFSTRRDHTGTYVITARTENDGGIDWRGDLSIDPLRAEGELALDKVRVETLTGYAGDAVPFGVRSGTASLKTKYLYADAGEDSEIALGPADLTVDALELHESKDSPSFLTLPRLEVGGLEIDLDKEVVRIASVSSKGVRLNLWLEADGAMGPESLFGGAAEEPPEAAQEAAAANDSESPGWSVNVAKATIADYGVAFEDRSVAPAFTYAVEPIAINVAKLSSTGADKAEVEVDVGLPDEAHIKLTGTAGLTPLAVDLAVETDGLLLSRFQPYVARAARIDVAGGAASTNGQLRVHAAGGETAVIEYAGAAAVKDLVVNDVAREEELVKWTSLRLGDIAYRSQPASLSIKGVVLEEPYARVLIDKDGNLNLASLAVESEPPAIPEAAAAAEPPAERAEAEMTTAIDTLEITGGRTDFADFSIKPSVDTAIYDLHGKIQGLSSDPDAKAQVVLQGNVDKHAPAKITGVINPFNPLTQTDVSVKFDNVSLTLFTPYSARFAGYKIKRGKASVELEYRIDDGRLVAENHVVLDKLTLGENVPGPDATSLPVKLAVALLKDRKGRINIDLPVRGNLDDPQFSYSTILVNTLIDLITKTVASPFSVLGSLANFDSEELSHVEFAPGSAELGTTESKKLDAIGEALRERPELRLEVTGRADPVADKKLLAEAELEKELKRAKRAEMKAEGLEAPKKLSQIDLSPEEYDRFFIAKYENAFGSEPPRNEQGGFADVARTALIGSLTIDDEDLRGLARRRASAIQDRLAEAGVEQERVYILDVEVDADFDGKPVRSELSLSS